MAEFGVPKGLAVTLPWDQMIQQEQRNTVMRQQKQIQAEAKAKMYADDTSYKNAMNGFDNPIVKQKMQERTSMLGKFMSENQGWETSPQLRAIYNNIKAGYKDDADLNRGLQSDGNIEMMSKYLGDPKNADIVGSLSDDGVNTVGDNWKQQMANYVKYGNQHGEIGRKNAGVQPFMFTAPEDLFDTTKRAKEILNDSKMHGYESKNEKGFIGGTRQFSTNEDKLNAAQDLLQDQVGGKFYKKQWNSISPEDQKMKYGGDARKYIAEKYNAFFPDDKYDKGQQPMDRYHGGSGRGNTGPQRNLFEEHLQNSFNNPGTPVQAQADGASNMFGDNNGNYNFSGAVIRNGKGNMIPINAGTVRKEKTSLANSKTIFIPDAKNPKQGKFYTSATVQMPIDQYNQNVWGGENAVDDGARSWTNWFADDPSKNSEIIEKKYKDTDFRIVKDDKGENMVEFEVWNPTDNNTSNANAYNFGAGLREKFTSDDNASAPTNNQPKQVVQNGVTYTYNQQTGQYE